MSGIRLGITGTLHQPRELLQVDKDLPTPVYVQLRDRLRTAIASGAYHVGHALPSERDLASGLGLSRMTVRRAIEELVSEGLLEQRHGSGTFVRGRRLEQTVDRVIGFTDEARHLGFTPGTRTLEIVPVPADAEVARALGYPPGTLVLAVRRVRTADGVPLALQVAHLRPDLTGLDAETLRTTGSLYRTIEAAFGVRPRRARQTVTARLPMRDERILLEIGATEPVLAQERTTFDETERPFEFVRSAYRGDRYALVLDLRAPEPG
jgi:GntR family transcriptional regulator